jgi:hypothetical protein
VTILAILAILAIIALLELGRRGHRHISRRRRARLTVRESVPGPFGTWLSISKRFRQ